MKLKGVKMNATVPTYQQIKGQLTPVTDFASATGANTLAFFADPNQPRSAYGPVWTRELGDDYSRVMTYTAGPAHDSYISHTVDSRLGVMPRLTADQQGKFGLLTLDNQQYLTVNGTLAYYPQKHVTNKLNRTLTQALGIQASDLRCVGAFSLLGDYRDEIHGYQVEMVPCFHYHGNNYVPMRHTNAQQEIVDDWFACAPIAATRDATTGELQCQTALMAVPFAHGVSFIQQVWPQQLAPRTVLTTDQYPIGKFLNKFWLRDLELSAQFNKNYYEEKMTHLKDDFLHQSLRSSDRYLPNYEIK